MNAALPRKRSPFLKLFNLSFTFYQVSQKSCTCECVVSAGIRWCFCCHLAIFHGVVDMVHLKITLLKRNIKISSKTPWESGFQLRGEKVQLFDVCVRVAQATLTFGHQVQHLLQGQERAFFFPQTVTVLKKTLTIALFCLNLKVSFFEIREVYDRCRYNIYIRGVSSVLV